MTTVPSRGFTKLLQVKNNEICDLKAELANAKRMQNISYVDGVLVGAASLIVMEFIGIILVILYL